MFEWAGDFSEGLAPVEIGGFVGYINRKGDTVIEARFTYAEGFRDGRALVMDGENIALIDRRGRVVRTMTP